MNDTTQEATHAALRAAFEKVYDPEFGVSIQDLGLIYETVLGDDGTVTVVMTLTSMYCPAGDVIVEGVKSAAEGVPGITRAEVRLVWDPLWTPELLSPAAREQLGWDQPIVDD
jgi:metal-sulfur cluster biosynthetic enzyme